MSGRATVCAFSFYGYLCLNIPVMDETFAVNTKVVFTANTTSRSDGFARVTAVSPMTEFHAILTLGYVRVFLDFVKAHA